MDTSSWPRPRALVRRIVQVPDLRSVQRLPDSRGRPYPGHQGPPRITELHQGQELAMSAGGGTL